MCVQGIKCDVIHFKCKNENIGTADVFAFLKVERSTFKINSLLLDTTTYMEVIKIIDNKLDYFKHPKLCLY